MLRMRAIEQETFSILTTSSDTTATVRFSGNGDTAAVEPLDAYLVSLHAQSVAKGMTIVDVDLTELYFMNSSCLKAFASWIHDVKSQGSPYRVRLQTNPNLNWQKRTLKTLGRMAPDVVSIEEI